RLPGLRDAPHLREGKARRGAADLQGHAVPRPAGLHARRLAHPAARPFRRDQGRGPDAPALRRAACRGGESGDNEAHARSRARRGISRRRPRGRAGRGLPLAGVGHPPAPGPFIAMNSPIAHFNGELLPLDRIHISPLDRGFIFGDGVYEVIPVYDGVPLRAREHFERLQRSMDEIALANPHTVDEWIALTMKLLAHHPGDQGVYIQVTRGVPPKRDHVIPKGLTPTVFMMCQPLVTPSREQVDNGVACVTSPDFRWEKCHIKST